MASPEEESGLRLTQRDLAKRLGVSQATVSRILAGSRRHSETLRAQVKALAETAGYRPDPVLSSLNAYRRTRRPIASGGTLAWLGSWKLGSNAYDAALYHAARKRAMQLGYGMDHLWLSGPGTTPEQISRVCAARGIVGAVVGPPPKPHTRLALDVRNMAAVALGRAIDWPPLDLVSVDHFQTMELCFQRLQERGYRRIGFTLASDFHERAAGLWNAAYLGQQFQHPDLPALPSFLSKGPYLPEAFREWLRKGKPDAVITMGSEHGCVNLLTRLGLRFPDDLGVALLMVPENDPSLAGFSGIREPMESLSCFAVDILVNSIHHNEKGVPADRRVHLLPGAWQGGASTSG